MKKNIKGVIAVGMALVMAVASVPAANVLGTVKEVKAEENTVTVKISEKTGVYSKDDSSAEYAGASIATGYKWSYDDDTLAVVFNACSASISCDTNKVTAGTKGYKLPKIKENGSITAENVTGFDYAQITTQKDGELVFYLRSTSSKAQIKLFKNGTVYSDVKVDDKAANEKDNSILIGKGDNIKITISDVKSGDDFYLSNDCSASSISVYDIILTYTEAVESTEPAKEAKVSFVSDFGQIISADTVSSDNVAYPEIFPSKAGYTFTGWDMTVEEIKVAIETATSEEEVIEVKPTYVLQDTKKCTFNMNIDGTVTSAEYDLGTNVKCEAPVVDGKTFKCWAKDAAGTQVLSYNPGYSYKVTDNSKAVTVYAVYGSEKVDDAKPVSAVIVADKITETYDNKSKLRIVVTHAAPEGVTIEEQGVVYSTTNANPTIADKVVAGKDTSSTGVLTVFFNNADTVDHLYACGYIKYNNGQVVYSDVATLK